MDIAELIGKTCKVSEEEESYEIQGATQDEQGKISVILKSTTDGTEILCNEEKFSYLFTIDTN